MKMNKLIKLGICVMAMSAILTGCADENAESIINENENFEVVEEMENVNSTYTHCNISVIRDKETGVEYLLVNDDEITPRLKGNE